MTKAMKKHPLVGKVILIDTQSNKLYVPGNELHGEIDRYPYDDVKDAETCIRESAENCIDDSSSVRMGGEDKDWGSNYLVCQIVKIVRPIPKMALSVRIMDVKE